VQLPLPKHIDEEKVLPSYLPATPFGIMQMLDRYEIETSGKHCVVIGRSNIVGTPMSILLSRKAKVGNCTVTLTHSRTKDLKAETLRADIIIAAIGRADYLTADMVKEGVSKTNFKFIDIKLKAIT